MRICFNKKGGGGGDDWGTLHPLQGGGWVGSHLRLGLCFFVVFDTGSDIKPDTLCDR